MVGTVYNQFFSIKFIKKRARCDAGKVMLIVFNILMFAGGGKILNQGTAQSDIDDLHAFTDAKQGKMMADAIVYSLNLKNIQFGIDIT